MTATTGASHGILFAEAARAWGRVAAVRETAWKALTPLTRRYRALIARAKCSSVAITAVARELTGFMWAIARMEPVKS